MVWVHVTVSTHPLWVIEPPRSRQGDQNERGGWHAVERRANADPGVYRDPRSCYVASLTGGMTAD